MEITSKIYSALVDEISNYTTAESYASDLALSSLWNDDLESEVPSDRIHALLGFYQVTNYSVRELLKVVGITQTALSVRFSIPLRTIQCWVAPVGTSAHRDCPLYIRLMMAECFGLVPFTIK